MLVKEGTPVSPGIVIAEAVVLGLDEQRVPLRQIGRGEVDTELRRLDRAVAQAGREIEEEIGNLAAGFELPRQILGVHRDMIRDPALRAAVEKTVRGDHLSAESALARVMEGYYRRFEEMDSNYIAERSLDLRDIERRIVGILIGKRHGGAPQVAKPSVIIARNLAPGETATLDREKVLAFAIDVGGRTSHTAILARALQIPAVVGLETISGAVRTGDLVIVDGYRGKVIVQPDKKTVEEYRSRAVSHRQHYQLLLKEIPFPTETVDGYELAVAANIELPEEIHSAVEWGAAGIGLYRSEFLFDGADLDEEKHYRTYRGALKTLRDRFMVVRTMDLGGDKLPGGSRASEVNPFLGCRAIRLSLEQPDLFKAQVRAILRASAHGTVRLMLPMVSNLDELRSARDLIRQVEDDLRRRGIEFDPEVKVGIMVEVPSVALMADQFAREVDFFSIGTNDLIQYVLAVDRNNRKVGPLYEPLHPAVIHCISTVVKAGRRAGKRVSLCGEMASDPTCTLLLVGLGLDDLSMGPFFIPAIKRLIRAVTFETARDLADEVLRLATIREIKERVFEVMRDLGVIDIMDMYH